MAFEMEILFRKMAPQPFPRGRRLEIVDLKGMTFRDVGSEWFGFAKTVCTSCNCAQGRTCAVQHHHTAGVYVFSPATRIR